MNNINLNVIKSIQEKLKRKKVLIHLLCDLFFIYYFLLLEVLSFFSFFMFIIYIYRGFSFIETRDFLY